MEISKMACERCKGDIAQGVRAVAIRVTDAIGGLLTTTNHVSLCAHCCVDLLEGIIEETIPQWQRGGWIMRSLKKGEE